jgi:hypothetical protein
MVSDASVCCKILEMPYQRPERVLQYDFERQQAITRETDDSRGLIDNNSRSALKT